MKVSRVFTENAVAKKKYVINQGGTSSTKTYSILQVLIIWATKKGGLLFSIVSETLPHLKKGAHRDFKIMLDKQNVEYEEHKTDYLFTFKSEDGGTSQIEFFSADQGDRAKGPRRDVLFLNEANNMKFVVAEQLMVRTRKRVFIDYNPSDEFWVQKTLMKEYADNHVFIKSTYKDNEFLTEEEVRDIEAKCPVYLINKAEFKDWQGLYFRDKNAELLRGRPEWWHVYGLGNQGVIEGRIFPNIILVDDFPKDETTDKSLVDRFTYGLDFGFTNDPTAVVKIAIVGDDLFIQELVYERALTNDMIVARLHENLISTSDIIIADSADPKSIKEISNKGFTILGAQKGPDSVKHGIDTMKRYNIKLLNDSLNLIREMRSYVWMTNKDADELNKPADRQDDHAIDAARYAAQQVIAPEIGEMTEFIWNE